MSIMEAQELATHIVKKLVNAGYIAYFAGGWVRDLIMGFVSDDIDIATNAPPEKILDLFPNTIHVGIAFGIIVVSMQGHQFEVATFRSDAESKDGRRPLGIKPATPQEDAQRRDFTINGLFYDPMTREIHDYVHGREDIKKGIIKTIGNPYDRFYEDRLRIIRAVRFSSRFRFTMEENTKEAILETAPLLFPSVSMERIWQEFKKMISYPGFDLALMEMHRLKILEVIFPSLSSIGLHTIKERVSSFFYFPKNTPTIAYLLELFPDVSNEEIENICRYLKISNTEIKFALLLAKAKHLTKREQSENTTPDSCEWCRFYAEREAQKCLEIIAASYQNDKKSSFLNKHFYRRQELEEHIQRIHKREPLVSSNYLKEVGVLPGKQMGILLKEAERLAINHDLHTKDNVMQLLQISPFWPKS